MEQTAQPGEAPAQASDTDRSQVAATRPAPPTLPKEIGGPAGPEPTRYGDWEQKGRCTDF
ncbi:DUF1674 domain-containing protein [Limobrevibacterium gyesilva]|uniref:DUF1674 domain-containing protein n=1 Tax=Limobrevibacterium gyesilva TaxID=2991712 RepID=A0AA41YPK1_9PROT|nr:DUF1674 domain-containing protein [Limobrevibacterium gyesilva]MCW3477749.1 DUF1674 domain-containing protein [Limobrevibacterium gyesilva]